MVWGFCGFATVIILCGARPANRSTLDSDPPWPSPFGQSTLSLFDSIEQVFACPKDNFVRNEIGYTSVRLKGSGQGGPGSKALKRKGTQDAAHLWWVPCAAQPKPRSRNSWNEFRSDTRSLFPAWAYAAWLPSHGIRVPTSGYSPFLNAQSVQLPPKPRVTAPSGAELRGTGRRSES